MRQYEVIIHAPNGDSSQYFDDPTSAAQYVSDQQKANVAAGVVASYSFNFLQGGTTDARIPYVPPIIPPPPGPALTGGSMTQQYDPSVLDVPGNYTGPIMDRPPSIPTPTNGTMGVDGTGAVVTGAQHSQNVLRSTFASGLDAFDSTVASVFGISPATVKFVVYSVIA